jgi:methionine-rich copper-binding protein CopC
MTEEAKKSFTANKLLFALVLFVALGFLLNTIFTYSQTSLTQSTLEDRAVVGDESLKLNREQSEQIKVLLEEIKIIKEKLENIEKSGKLNK